MNSNAIRLLPPEQKEIVFLRYSEELSFKEIASLNDISINTALGHMSYAILKLQKIIASKKICL